MKDFSLFMVE